MTTELSPRAYHEYVEVASAVSAEQRIRHALETWDFDAGSSWFAARLLADRYLAELKAQWREEWKHGDCPACREVHKWHVNRDGGPLPALTPAASLTARTLSAETRAAVVRIAEKDRNAALYPSPDVITLARAILELNGTPAERAGE